MDEDRAIVTQNARDFRKLVGRGDIHPGLIILPPVGRERSWDLLLSVMQAIADRGEPGSVMINRVAEIDVAGGRPILCLTADCARARPLSPGSAAPRHPPGS